MGKSLIIKGADFSANAIERISVVTKEYNKLFQVNNADTSTLYNAGEVEYANLPTLDYKKGVYLKVDISSTSGEVVGANYGKSAVTEFIDVEDYTSVSITGSCGASGSGAILLLAFYNSSKKLIHALGCSTNLINGNITKIIGETFTGTLNDVTIPEGTKYIRSCQQGNVPLANEFKITLKKEVVE